MKRETLLIIIILAAGISFSGVSYATITGTTITNSGVTTPTISTNSCSGCGSTEGDFTTYTLQYNKTTSQSSLAGLVNSTGFAWLGDSSAATLTMFSPTGTVITNKTNNDGGFASPSTFTSLNNKYVIYEHSYGNTSSSVIIIKNTSTLQTLRPITQLNGQTISPNGQYIIIIQAIQPSGEENVLLYKGS